MTQKKIVYSEIALSKRKAIKKNNMTIGANNLNLQGHFSRKNLENVLFDNKDKNGIFN